MLLALEELKKYNELLKTDLSKKQLAVIYERLLDEAPKSYLSKKVLSSRVKEFVRFQLRSYALENIVV